MGRINAIEWLGAKITERWICIFCSQPRLMTLKRSSERKRARPGMCGKTKLLCASPAQLGRWAGQEGRISRCSQEFIAGQEIGCEVIFSKRERQGFEDGGPGLSPSSSWRDMASGATLGHCCVLGEMDEKGSFRGWEGKEVGGAGSRQEAEPKQQSGFFGYNLMAFPSAEVRGFLLETDEQLLACLYS